MLDHRAYLDHLHQELTTYRSTLAVADLRAEVAACPGWDVAELTRHLGQVHRWAAAIVSTGEPAEWPSDSPSDAELPGWFTQSNALVTSALEAADPSAPGWGLLGAGEKGFWFRRQAQEALVHRIDLELALGARTPSSAELAADGVQEVWDVMMPRNVKRQLTAPILAPVTLHACDTGTTWTLHPGHTVTLDDSGQARIEGRAEALLLLLWKRIALDSPQLSFSGDAATLESVAAGRLTP